MKKRLIFITAAIMAAGSLTGGSMAVYHAVANTDKTISTSSINVKLNIEGGKTDNDGNIIFSSDDIKNGKVEEKVSAINSGNRAQYVRIKIDKSWVNNTKQEDGKEVSITDCKYIGINLINDDDWITSKDNENDSEMYIYYKSVLNPNEKTSDFMDSFTLFNNVNENTNKYSGLSAKINFDAQAIQTTAVADAMLNEWGVLAEFDENGNITAIYNQ